LSPVSDTTVLTPSGPLVLAAQEITTDSVGHKAFGLSSIPPNWTPPFVVLEAALFDTETAGHDIEQFLLGHFDGDWQMRPDSQVIVRSSGTAETISQRGRLDSQQTVVSDVERTIRRLIAEAPDIGDSRLHWIVQPLVLARAKGGLSNERRTSEEGRDWLLEVERLDGAMQTQQSRLAIRRWRHGEKYSSSGLACYSIGQISIALREVAKWGCSFAPRLLLEWVWDGSRLWMVQADVAEETGVNPNDFIHISIPNVSVSKLSAFREATDDDFARYRKLSNARLYSELGYKMPSFYVLDDPEIVSSIVAGTVPDSLSNDLEILTKRPLILRSDSDNVPDEDREMLPRSDELHTCAAAKEWLTESFRQRLVSSGLAEYKFCLIAHHFIPSVASAWARAEPGSPLVRIESLWGVPEGLYWHAYDSYEVDTGSPRLPKEMPKNPGYTCAVKTRFKSTFVASRPDGSWGYFSPKRPYDWNRSIHYTAWLNEIAYMTRRIAEAKGQPIGVMWFIDNHRKATPNRIMPWYHSRSEFLGTPKAAPTRKWRRSQDIIIRSLDDWNDLRTHDFGASPIERVSIVPNDSNLIRNREFVDAIAVFAKEHDFVIELSGSILAHAYFRFQHFGARVECVDLYAKDDTVSVFNKVVRDRIPELISERGEKASTVRLVGDALDVALRRKLVEEALEALDARSGDETLEELADVLEVVHGICHALNQPMSAIEERRREKRKKRGGFESGLMLEQTVTPQAIATRAKEPAHGEPGTRPGVISDPAFLPESRTYTKRDLRAPQDVEIEKMFTVRTEITEGRAEESLNFDLPGEPGAQKFTLALELQREGGSIRAVVRLRKSPSQMRLDLEPNQVAFDFLNRK
jgi:predicted house-cleaning noncanonical NTP pyrophosphatase (MazG superfamily)